MKISRITLDGFEIKKKINGIDEVLDWKRVGQVH